MSVSLPAQERVTHTLLTELSLHVGDVCARGVWWLLNCVHFGDGREQPPPAEHVEDRAILDQRPPSPHPRA